MISVFITNQCQNNTRCIAVQTKQERHTRVMKLANLTGVIDILIEFGDRRLPK
jgi:hypothetical protein